MAPRRKNKRKRKGYDGPSKKKSSIFPDVENETDAATEDVKTSIDLGQTMASKSFADTSVHSNTIKPKPVHELLESKTTDVKGVPERTYCIPIEASIFCKDEIFPPFNITTETACVATAAVESHTQFQDICKVNVQESEQKQSHLLVSSAPPKGKEEECKSQLNGDKMQTLQREEISEPTYIVADIMETLNANSEVTREIRLEQNSSMIQSTCSVSGKASVAIPDSNETLKNASEENIIEIQKELEIYSLSQRQFPFTDKQYDTPVSGRMTTSHATSLITNSSATSPTSASSTSEALRQTTKRKTTHPSIATPGEVVCAESLATSYEIPQKRRIIGLEGQERQLENLKLPQRPRRPDSPMPLFMRSSSVTPYEVVCTKSLATSSSHEASQKPRTIGLESQERQLENIKQPQRRRRPDSPMPLFMRSSSSQLSNTFTSLTVPLGSSKAPSHSKPLHQSSKSASFQPMTGEMPYVKVLKETNSEMTPGQRYWTNPVLGMFKTESQQITNLQGRTPVANQQFDVPLPSVAHATRPITHPSTTSSRPALLSQSPGTLQGLKQSFENKNSHPTTVVTSCADVRRKALVTASHQSFMVDVPLDLSNKRVKREAISQQKPLVKNVQREVSATLPYAQSTHQVTHTSTTTSRSTPLCNLSPQSAAFRETYKKRSTHPVEITTPLEVVHAELPARNSSFEDIQQSHLIYTEDRKRQQGSFKQQCAKDRRRDNLQIPPFKRSTSSQVPNLFTKLETPSCSSKAPQQSKSLQQSSNNERFQGMAGLMDCKNVHVTPRKTTYLIQNPFSNTSLTSQTLQQSSMNQSSQTTRVTTDFKVVRSESLATANVENASKRPFRPLKTNTSVPFSKRSMNRVVTNACTSNADLRTLSTQSHQLPVAHETAAPRTQLLTVLSPSEVNRNLALGVSRSGETNMLPRLHIPVNSLGSYPIWLRLPDNSSGPSAMRYLLVRDKPPTFVTFDALDPLPNVRLYLHHPARYWPSFLIPRDICMYEHGVKYVVKPSRLLKQDANSLGETLFWHRPPDNSSGPGTMRYLLIRNIDPTYASQDIEMYIYERNFLSALSSLAIARSFDDGTTLTIPRFINRPVERISSSHSNRQAASTTSSQSFGNVENNVQGMSQMRLNAVNNQRSSRTCAEFVKLEKGETNQTEIIESAEQDTPQSTANMLAPSSAEDISGATNLTISCTSSDSDSEN